MNTSISVVLRTKNEAKLVGAVLRRLAEQQYDGHVETILVDSGSSDDTVSIAASFGCRIIAIKPEDFSFGRALNVGIREASGDIIVNLSGHSVPTSTDYFTRILAPFKDPNVAAAYGRDVPWPDAFPSQARDILNYFPDGELSENKFSNANAALRKDAWTRIAFDEHIAAAEDMLWSRQILTLGYKIQYVPGATVFHSHGPSLRYVYRRAIIESRSLNAMAATKHAFTLAKAIDFFGSHVKGDVLFALHHKHHVKWLLHIPLYRFAQTVGLFRGFRDGARETLDSIEKIGRYSFESTKTGHKALLVVHGFFPDSVGGTEYYTASLAKGLIERGWDVTVLTAKRDATQARYNVTVGQYDGIKVVRINNFPESGATFVDYFIDHTIDDLFEKIVLAERPDVIHFQHTPNLSARLPEVAHSLGVPSVFTLHDYWYLCRRSDLVRPSKGICPGPSDGVYCATCHDPSGPPDLAPRFPLLHRMLQRPVIRRLRPGRLIPAALMRRIDRVLYRRATGAAPAQARQPIPIVWNIFEHSFRFAFMKKQLSFPRFVVSPSRHLKRRYEREGFRDIVSIPHGLPLKERVDRRSFDGDLVLGYLGNVLRQKGLHVFLNEMKDVKQRQRVTVLIFGKIVDEWYKRELDECICASPEVSVSFMGQFAEGDLHGILSRVHAVVFPSLWEESYSFVVREALAHGVPVISSRLGGPSEVIEDGLNGLLFDPYKRGDLSEKIDRLLEDPSVLAGITDGARNTRIERVEDHVDSILTVYSEAIGQP